MNQVSSSDKKPKTARGKRTREKLLRAAEIEFGEKGFHEAGISGITYRAGVALGTFYTYFESKEEIFRALVNFMSRRTREWITQSIAGSPDRLTTERRGIEAFIEFARLHKSIYRIIAEAEFIAPEEYRKHYEGFSRGYQVNLERAAQKGEIRAGDFETWSWSIMGTIIFLGMRYAEWDDSRPASEIADVVIDLIARGNSTGDKIMTTMGIVSTGTWFPETYITAAEIAKQSGMPEWVVREKLGINRKFVADPRVHPNEMAVNASRIAIEKANINPMDIDVVLCTTEEWREYLLWTTAIDLAFEVGAKRAWGLDIHTRCATTIAALKMARSLMADDPAVDTVLIGGGYAISHFIDLSDVNTSFLFNIGAGAGAMIVKRDWPENQVLGNHLIADGMMSRHVIVPSSGTVQPPTDQAVEQGGFKFRLVEPEAMKARLGEVSIRNWLECVDVSLQKSGTKTDGTPYTRADIDFFNMSLVKPSAHQEMLEHLGLTEEQSVYISDIGHIGEQDAIINIEVGIEQGRLKPGDTMAIIAAGIGYVWAGAIVQWGAAT